MRNPYPMLHLEDYKNLYLNILPSVYRIRKMYESKFKAFLDVAQEGIEKTIWHLKTDLSLWWSNFIYYHFLAPYWKRKYG